MPQTYSEKDTGFHPFVIINHDETADVFQAETLPTPSLSPILPQYNDASLVAASMSDHTTDTEKCVNAGQWQPPTLPQILTKYKILVMIMTAYLLVSITLTWLINFNRLNEGLWTSFCAQAFALCGLPFALATIVDLILCFRDLRRIIDRTLKQDREGKTEEEVRKERRSDYGRWSTRLNTFLLMATYHLGWTLMASFPP